MTTDRSFFEAALIGLENYHAQIGERLAAVREAMNGEKRGVGRPSVAPARPRRKWSAASRERGRQAQLKRWKEFRRKKRAA
jgi:hypothetical protein